MPQKIKSSKRAADFDSDDEVVSSSKKSKAVSSGPEGGAQIDAEGNQYWEISKNRRIAISEFKGKQLITIREYYEKDGQMLPGKKGISLTPEQYSTMIEALPHLEQALQAKGVSVPRPRYDTPANGEPGDEQQDHDDDDDDDEVKQNHEATNEEDS